MLIRYVTITAVRWPTRALQQEEEEQALATAAAALQPPQIHWSDQSQPVTQPQLLVSATLALRIYTDLVALNSTPWKQLQPASECNTPLYGLTCDC